MGPGTLELRSMLRVCMQLAKLTLSKHRQSPSAARSLECYGEQMLLAEGCDTMQRRTGSWMLRQLHPWRGVRATWRAAVRMAAWPVQTPPASVIEGRHGNKLLHLQFR